MSGAEDLAALNAKDAQGKWIPGNRNDGHDFGSKLSEDERHQLLEYLKTL